MSAPPDGRSSWQGLLVVVGKCLKQGRAALLWQHLLALPLPLVKQRTNGWLGGKLFRLGAADPFDYVARLRSHVVVRIYNGIRAVDLLVADLLFSLCPHEKVGSQLRQPHEIGMIFLLANAFELLDLCYR